MEQQNNNQVIEQFGEPKLKTYIDGFFLMGFADQFEGFVKAFTKRGILGSTSRSRPRRTLHWRVLHIFSNHLIPISNKKEGSLTTTLPDTINECEMHFAKIRRILDTYKVRSINSTF